LWRRKFAPDFDRSPNLVDALTDNVGLNRRETADLVDACFQQIGAALLAQDDVKLASFGNFGVRLKAPRTGRNAKPCRSRRGLSSSSGRPRFCASCSARSRLLLRPSAASRLRPTEPELRERGMPTRKASKSAGRVTMDEELRTARHDEILNWLVDSLDLVVDAMLTRSPEWIEKMAGEKRAESRRHLEDVCRRLEAVAQGRGDDLPRMGGPAASSAGGGPPRDAARAKAAELRAWLEHADWGRCAGRLGRASLLSWEILKPVAQLQPSKSPGRPRRRVDAGFVDLCASVARAATLELGGLAEFRRHSLVGSARDADILRDVTIGPLTWSASMAKFDLWVSVRSGPFTLGEVLHELKSLRLLEDAQQRVALCVDGLSADMASKLRHERLYVIDKSAFDAKASPFVVGASAHPLDRPVPDDHATREQQDR
jgi:nucleoid DNA-binding protein